MMIPPLLFLSAGLILLYFGAEGLVRGASSLALRLGISPLVVGLTVVAFGTSAPEMVVSLKSAMSGNGDISLGNVVGSNICNICLILGLAALIRPLKIEVDLIRFQTPIMIGAALALILMMVDGRLGRIDGVFLATGFVGFLIFTIVRARKEGGIGPEALPGHRKGLPLSIVMTAAGLVVLIFGADLFVRGAVDMARLLGVSEALIGLTIVAVGTSLPELATSLVAAIKGEADIAVGNVIGSNIFNILCILGLSALVRPLSRGGINWDSLGLMGLSALALLPLLRSGFKLSRMEGAALLAAYMAYLAWLASADVA